MIGGSFSSCFPFGRTRNRAVGRGAGRSTLHYEWSSGILLSKVVYLEVIGA